MPSTTLCSPAYTRAARWRELCEIATDAMRILHTR